MLLCMLTQCCFTVAPPSATQPNNKTTLGQRLVSAGIRIARMMCIFPNQFDYIYGVYVFQIRPVKVAAGK